jgi:RecA/RadA recombinase
VYAHAQTRTRDTSPHAIADTVNAQLRAHVVRVGAQPGAPRPAVSSGFPALDSATRGGFPRGRITELIGRPTAGRETVAARAVASTEGYSAWIDVGGQLDVDRLARWGVDLTRLLILRPLRLADTLGIAVQALTAGCFQVVVLDALSDLPADGATAAEVGRVMRVAIPRLATSSTAALVLSAPEQYHRPLAHGAALRIAFTRVDLIRHGGVFRGWRTRAQILKSPGLQGGESGIEVWLP